MSSQTSQESNEKKESRYKEVLGPGFYDSLVTAGLACGMSVGEVQALLDKDTHQILEMRERYKDGLSSLKAAKQITARIWEDLARTKMQSLQMQMLDKIQSKLDRGTLDEKVMADLVKFFTKTVKDSEPVAAKKKAIANLTIDELEARMERLKRG